ncbi:MAG TPA: hypothetical protein VN907_08985 [Actinomycetes bacterium]|nr:hypothetical protein [Actinomycetes bacterium]
MDSVTSPPPGQTATYPLGVREPLPVVDLPEPEEVFGVPRLGRKEVVKFFSSTSCSTSSPGRPSSSSEPMAAALARWALLPPWPSCSV